MKRLMIILFAIGITTMSSTGMAAMSKSQVRKEARFLTDKMAYELNLSVGQRNDAYEINYDFIYSVRDLMDNVIYGEEWAMNRYYYLLDIRNDDLRWVLTERQYRGFMQADYFFRPIYASGNKWSFRIYITYSNRNHFFFGKPHHYTTYHFVHHRPQNNHVSYYRGRYDHLTYKRAPGMSEPKVNNNYRRSDFSPVTTRPNATRPSATRPNTSRPNATQPNATRPNATQPNATRPNATRPNASQPKEVTNTNRRPATSNSKSSSVRISTGSEQNNKVNTGTDTNKRSVGTSSRKSSAPSVNSSSSDSSSKRSSVSSSSGSSAKKSSSTSGSSSRSRSSDSGSSSTGSKSRR